MGIITTLAVTVYLAALGALTGIPENTGKPHFTIQNGHIYMSAAIWGHLGEGGCGEICGACGENHP